MIRHISSHTLLFRRIAAVVPFVLVLSACHGNLDALDVTVTSRDATVLAEVRDQPRKTPEEELVITAAAAEPYEIRFAELAPAEDVATLRIAIDGDFRGGGVILSAADASAAAESRRYPFADMISAASGTAPGGDGRWVFTMTLPDWFVQNGVIPADSGVAFYTDDDPGYRVEAIAFARREDLPAVRWTEATGLFDDRLAVTARDREWRISGLDRHVGPSDAVVIDYRHDATAFTDRSRRPQISVDLDGIAVTAYTRPGDHRLVIRPDLWNAEVRSLVVNATQTGEGAFTVHGVSVLPMATEALEPLPIELTELKNYPAARWRNEEYELFSWSLYPDILWIDSRDYQIQARFFKRLAFFVEKRGSIGTLLSDGELAGRHGYNAHNYRPEGLAAFYNAVEDVAFPINEHETLLREIVAARGLIVRDEDGRWAPGTGGILAVTQESGRVLRNLLIIHEAMHGVFYEESEFRTGVATYWFDALSERERHYYRDAFAWMGYAPDDDYLMYNEFQAYMLQQSEPAVRWYFRTRMSDRVRNYGRRYEPVDAFLGDHLTTFVDAGGAINALLFQTAGMVGGDPYCFVVPDKTDG
ncbi:MAG: hypothetical protein PF508_14435 [Spirochaeta sp.]|jgi:hypothetical protein|nr:hypothetical protein [Spirochaeta sp.]